MGKPLALVVALALGLGGCGDDSSSAGEDDAANADTPRAKIGIDCRAASELAEGDRQALDQAARAIFGSLRAGDTQALWAALHPQAQREDTREAFTASVDAIHDRLAGTAETVRQEWAWVVDVRGGVTDLARIPCGDDPQAPTLTWVANAGNEDLAVVSLVTTRDPFTYATTIQLRKRDATWRLLGVQTNLASYRGKTALDFEAQAARWAEERKIVAAYLMLGIAQTLAERGGSLETADGLRLDDAVARIGRTNAFVEATTSWDVDGDTYDILGLSVVATADDIAVLVKYVNERGLVADLLGRDADALMDHVRTRFPELRDVFAGVVFEAYPQRPTDDGAPVQAYRTVRLFEGEAPTPSPAADPSAPAAPAAASPTP